MTSRICVVIPAYNASETIADVVRGALRHVPFVIVADDGSTDGTAKLAVEAGARVVSIEKNQGKGHALKVLFQTARNEGCDAVVSMDADMQHNPEDIPRFLEAHSLHPRDVIVGSRMHEMEKIPRGRHNSMLIARFYISLAANQFIGDTQCGFRLYPLSLVKDIVLTTDRYVTEAEILMKAGGAGVLIRSVRVETIYDNNNSHFRPVMDIVAITAYVISYIVTKWLVEGVLSDRPYTYAPNNIRDIIGRYTTIDTVFQTMTLLLAPVIPVFFFVEQILFSPIVKNNYVSIRRFNIGFPRIILVTHLLLILPIIAIVEKSWNAIGSEVQLVDRFVKRVVPSFEDTK